MELEPIVNNVYRQWDFPQHDDRCGQMGESKVTAFELLIPHEQLAEAIEPAMRHLGLVRRFPYAIFYEYVEGLMTVYGVFHTSRDPNKWRQHVQ